MTKCDRTSGRNIETFAVRAAVIDGVDGAVYGVLSDG